MQFHMLHGRAAVQDETVLVHFFLKGLTPKCLRTTCLTRGPTTLQEAIEVATRLEPMLGITTDRSSCVRCNTCGSWKDVGTKCTNPNCFRSNASC